MVTALLTAFVTLFTGKALTLIDTQGVHSFVREELHSSQDPPVNCHGKRIMSDKHYMRVTCVIVLLKI